MVYAVERGPGTTRDAHGPPRARRAPTLSLLESVERKETRETRAKNLSLEANAIKPYINPCVFLSEQIKTNTKKSIKK
jgi:hypothetical protein